MVIKFGGGGGGGIGAVILLGGVLATAALASAFAARRKGRSSGGKDRRSFHQNPPPENDKLSEQDEGDTDALSLDVKLSGVPDDGFVIVDEDFPDSDEKLPVESENKIPEDEQTKEEENQKQVRYIEMIELDKVVGEERESGDEERESGLKDDMEVKLEREDVEGFCSGEAELMSEKKCLQSGVVSDNENEERESGLHTEIVDEERESGDEERENELKEDMEVKLEKKDVEGFCSGKAELMSEKKCLQNVVIEDEIERESGLHTKIVEIVLEDEENLVEKQEKCEEKERNETRDKIEEKEDEKNREENGYILHQIPNGIADEEQAEFDAKKNVEKEADVSPEATNEGIDEAKSCTNTETSEEEEEEEKEEIVEESSLESGDSSSESNSEAVWPADSAKPKLVDYEVGERDDQMNTKEKTFIDKYYVGEMETKNDRRTNSGRRRVAIATLLLLSSLSCSWFFGLSSVNLCLVVFLTMLLSEIHGC